MKGESTTRSVAGLAALAAPASVPPPTAEPAAPQVGESPTAAPVHSAGGLLPAPPKPLRTAQALVVATMLGLALLVGWRIGSVEGLWRVARVEGSSMAPALCGLHYRVACADCRFPFRCDAVDAPGDGLAVCPNCGFTQNRLAQASLAAAEQVLIDRWAARWRAPQRYDLVAAREVAGVNGLVVKRIAGLPFERPAIGGGDLYDGEDLIRKSLHQLRQVRQLVHDNNYQPHGTPPLPPRWQSDSPNSGWHASGTGFRFRQQPKVEGFDWLQYQHWQCIANPLPRTRLSPVLDNDSYNQAASRQLNAVPDVQLSCRIRVSGQGRLALAAVDGSERFEVVLDVGPGDWNGALFAERADWQNNEGQNDEELEFVSAGHFAIASEPVRIEFGLCDQQVLLAIGGRPLVRHSYTRRTVGQRVLHPLAIGAAGLHVEISELRVWRDQYLLEPLGTPRRWQAGSALASDGYFLIGDNLTLSADSRHWPNSGVPRSHMLGRVYRPFWAK